MKVLTTLAVTSSLAFLPVPFTLLLAADQGSGLVTLGGQIIDTACAIEAGSAYQVIEMDPSPIGRLVREGESEPHPFSLQLANCTLTRYHPDRPNEKLPDWQHVRVTFDGLPDRKGTAFAAFGSSEGVALRITDAEGRESIPGVPMPLSPLTGKDQVLHYTLRLVGNDLPISVGTHRAAVRFRLEYF